MVHAPIPTKVAFLPYDDAWYGGKTTKVDYFVIHDPHHFKGCSRGHRINENVSVDTNGVFMV